MSTGEARGDAMSASEGCAGSVAGPVTFFSCVLHVKPCATGTSRARKMNDECNFAGGTSPTLSLPPRGRGSGVFILIRLP